MGSNVLSRYYLRRSDTHEGFLLRNILKMAVFNRSGETREEIIENVSNTYSSKKH